MGITSFSPKDTVTINNDSKSALKNTIKIDILYNNGSKSEIFQEVSRNPSIKGRTGISM